MLEARIATDARKPSQFEILVKHRWRPSLRASNCADTRAPFGVQNDLGLRDRCAEICNGERPGPAFFLGALFTFLTHIGMAYDASDARILSSDVGN